MNPRISVLMSVYNMAPYLAMAVQSILDQTFADFEFLIVDDASSDGSRAVMDAFRDERIILLPNERNMGLTVSLNRALARARGALIARMDADDIALPARFAEQVRYLDAHPDVVALGSAVFIISAAGDLIGVDPWETDPERISMDLQRGKGGIPHPTLMARREDVLVVEGYDETYTVAQDKDLYMRLSKRGKLANLEQPLLMRREHETSIDSTRKKEQLHAAQRAANGRSERPVIGQRKNWAAYRYARWAKVASKSGNFAMAGRFMKKQLRNRPLGVQSWIAVVRVFYEWFNRSPRQQRFSQWLHACPRLTRETTETRRPGDGYMTYE